MTQIIEDSLDVNLQIGTTSEGFVVVPSDSFTDDAMFWNVIEAKVELSQAASPNYVKAKVSPQPQFLGDINDIISTDSNGSSPLFTGDGIARLVGSRFRLEVGTDLVAVPSDETDNNVRDLIDNTSDDVEDDALLFDGRLANISPIGTNLYEIIAYDPGQQSFNIGGESGSIINQKLDFTGTSVGFRQPGEAEDNNVTGDHSDTAVNIIESIVDEAGLDSRTTILEDDFKTNPPRGSRRQTRILFEKLVVPVKEALNRIREATNTEWWFDKDGTFYFGDPSNPELPESARTSVYETSLITDTSAGITTPPYQSVRVIGEGVATTEGWTGNSAIQDINDQIVVEANIAQPSSGGEQAEKVILLDPDDLQQPTFKYINAELATDRQAQNTALKIANELIKQQAEGSVTVVGMPEVQPLDGIVMPNTENQPMGGQLYGVYAVRHKLNASDGFKTEIEVSGPNPRIRAEADTSGDPGNIIPTSLDRDVYTPDGRRRAFGPGSGEGDLGGGGERTTTFDG